MVELAITPDGAENETGLHLENVLDLEDSYALIGKFTDAGELPGPLSISMGKSPAKTKPRTALKQAEEPPPPVFACL